MCFQNSAEHSLLNLQTPHWNLQAPRDHFSKVILEKEGKQDQITLKSAQYPNGSFEKEGFNFFSRRQTLHAHFWDMKQMSLLPSHKKSEAASQNQTLFRDSKSPT
jgi:hypothetical protein